MEKNIIITDWDSSSALMSLSVLLESIELKIELTTETRESRPWDHNFLVKKTKWMVFFGFNLHLGLENLEIKEIVYSI